MEASSGGTLELIGNVANTNGTTNGTIEALNGGTVLLSDATVSGGNITTVGTGVVLAENSSTLNGSTNTITNAGNLQIPNANTVYMTGTVNNTGTLALNGTVNNTILSVNSATATLEGSGTVTLSDSANNYILATTGGNQLTIAQPISGAGGDIGNGSLVLVNQSTIDATASAHGNVLYIQPDATFTNNGLLEATGGGTLVLYGGTFTNTGATITAGSGSTVDLEDSVDIVGGTLNGAGTFVSSSGTQLDGSSHTVTTAGTLEIPNSNNLYIKGTINNTGTLELNGTANNTFLYVNSPTATLQGSGTVTLSDSPGNYILAATGGNQLTIAQPISGPGGDIGNGSLVLVNQSTIDATKSASGNSLYIQPDGTMTNNGTLEATGGGSLILYGGTFTNTGATITAGSGSNVTLEAGVTVSGGTLNGAGLFTATNATLNGVTNAGTLQLPNSDAITLQGTITNSGALQVNGTANNTFLYENGAVTLNGGGTLTLSDSNVNYLMASAGGSSLTNTNNTISGSGNIGNGSLAFTNQSAGVVDAVSAKGNSLVINSGSLGATNAGIFEASSGGTMVLEGTINSTGGTVEGLAGTGTSAGGSVVINGADITGGTLNTLGTGVNASSMIFYNNAILNGVTNNGTIGLPNSDTAELQGTITNNGSIQVNGTANNTFLYINGNTTLNGSGTLVLGNSTVNYIYGANGTEVLTNNSNTIEGAGHIGNGNLGLVNNAGGTILANQPNELFIDSNSSGVTNNGTFQVNTGSILDVTGGPFNNFNSSTGTLTGGTYNVNGGTFQFDNANIVTNAADIILSGASSQIISNTNANALANFATNAAGGVFQLGPGRSFTTSAPGGGNFTNNGALIIGAGDTFKVAGSLSNFAGTTLTGGTYYVAGTLQFGAPSSQLVTNDANLTLAGTSAHLIDLAGNNLLSSFNSNAHGASFTVAAGGSYTTPGSFGNSGTIDLEQGSSLTVAGNLNNNGAVDTNNQNLGGGANTLTVTGTLTNNTNDTVTIGANSDTSDVANVGLLNNSGTVTVDKGATLKLTSSGADSNSGSISLVGGTLNVAAGTLTNSGTLDEESASKLIVAGNLTNNGTITTNGSNLKGGANSISISGTLTNNTGDSVTIGAHNDTADSASVGLLDNLGTITVDKNATFKLTATGADSNAGTINVDSGTMAVQAGTFTNSGSLDEENGGKLSVTGAMTNSGTLTTNGSNQGGTANSITVAGKLTNSGTGTLTIGANNDTSDTASVGTLTNNGAVTVDTGATLTLSKAGTDTNTGTIAVNGALDINAASTLSGGGSLTLTNGAITGGSAAPAFTNSSLIQGSGTISNLAITNTGTIAANQASPLEILPTAGGLTNNGTLTVAAGDTMQIGTSAGGALTNLSGTTLTGGTYTVSGTMQFGASGTTIATNAATITLNGAGQMLDFGNNNLLAGFNDNASSGAFKLAGGAALTTNGGSFTNAGAFTVATGTTFTVGGSSFNFTQTGGTSTIDGTLTSTTLGTLAVDGGTLDGAGTLGYNVVDDSTLTPGDSATKTGKLIVSDTYTQESGGALDIQINGATAGTKYDQLKVTQGATLGGTLNITLGFTPTVGQTFTILTASSVAGTFAAVNGLAINGSEHFTITYRAGSVVLTVVSGALPAASLVTDAIHPMRSFMHHGSENNRNSAGSRWNGFGVQAVHVGVSLPGGSRWSSSGSDLAPVFRPFSTTRTTAVGVSHPAGVSYLAPVFQPNGTFKTSVLGATRPLPVSYLAPVIRPGSMANVPASVIDPRRPFSTFEPVAPSGSTRALRAMDEGGLLVGLQAPSTGDGVLANMGISQVSAESYNSMSSMNHMRFECGVDLKALLKTSRKQLVRALWASPDSPEALSIGYMSFTGAH